MARTEKPPWWAAFVSMERVLGGRLESATRSDEFADFLTRTANIYARMRSAYDRATADALHRVNLPAWSDLRLLNEHVTSLERRLADLALELEKHPDSAARRRSSRRPPRASAR